MSNNDIDIHELEEGLNLNLDFNKLAKSVSQCSDIIPVAVQNADTLEVILVAYTNEYAMKESIATGVATFWSTSRNELWIKGKSSGNTYNVVDIRVNCEQNSLLYLVKPNGGGICHTSDADGKARNCYYRRYNIETQKLEFI